MSRRYKLFTRSVKRARSFAGTTIAQKAAAEITNSTHVKVVRRNIPRNIIDHVEKNIGVKFKKRPQFYTYEPTRGHFFKKKTECGEWDGASITGYTVGTGQIKGTIILLPKSHLIDKRLKDNVLTHELAETLVGQYAIQPHVKRKSSTINSIEHGFFAMAYEKKHLDKHKMTRQQMTALAKKLFNDKESWT
jgi:hypothetical protein